MNWWALREFDKSAVEQAKKGNLSTQNPLFEALGFRRAGDEQVIGGLGGIYTVPEAFLLIEHEWQQQHDPSVIERLRKVLPRGTVVFPLHLKHYGVHYSEPGSTETYRFLIVDSVEVPPRIRDITQEVSQLLGFKEVLDGTPSCGAVTPRLWAIAETSVEWLAERLHGDSDALRCQEVNS